MDYVQYGDHDARVREFFEDSRGSGSEPPFDVSEHRTGNRLPDGSWEPSPYSDWKDANPPLCPTDDAGFHIRQNGTRATTRDGRDAYAYSCRVCGVVGDIREGRFVAR